MILMINFVALGAMALVFGFVLTFLFHRTLEDDGDLESSAEEESPGPQNSDTEFDHHVLDPRELERRLLLLQRTDPITYGGAE